MNRFSEQMVTVRTAPDDSETMVELYFEVNGHEMLAGSISPNLLRGMGMPIDVDDPASWSSKVKLSKDFLRKLKAP